MNEQAMNKDKWIELFKTVGLDDEAMASWHRQFEIKYPEGHQSFLEWLRIPDDDVKSIRSVQ